MPAKAGLLTDKRKVWCAASKEIFYKEIQSVDFLHEILSEIDSEEVLSKEELMELPVFIDGRYFSVRYKDGLTSFQEDYGHSQQVEV